ncbi:MAG: nucleotidyltransferase domain-containing protein [Chloroflexi bacterium]|nr:nucleotidyltransferase domain-containing protein [Chloroflexota bacterium]
MVKEPVLNKQKLIEIARKHGAIYLALFGSYARGEAYPDSDVDLYARFGRHISLFEMLDVKHTMEDALGLKIDLLVEEIVIPYQFVRDGMTKDLVVLYEDVSKTHATT